MVDGGQGQWENDVRDEGDVRPANTCPSELVTPL